MQHLDRLIALLVLAFVLLAVSPLALAQPCIPKQPYPLHVHEKLLDLGVINGDGYRMMAVAWWQECSDSTQRLGYRVPAGYCDVSVKQARDEIDRLPAFDQAKYQACRLKVPALTSTAITAAWAAAPAASAVGLGWAQTALAEHLVATARPWVVDKATSTDGTRAAYPWANGARGGTSNGRTLAGSPCNAAIGWAPFFAVNGRTDQVAACVRR
jgi:hypothetical protein